MRRPPDELVGDPARPLMRRWMVWPHNRFSNLYLHNICRSDDDRALHDHPWCNVSIVLRGSYLEHLRGGRVRVRRPWRPWAPWRLVFRRAAAPHRIELPLRFGAYGKAIRDPVWTLFWTGPHVREWGFHCPRGWRHWREFYRPGAGVSSSRGCR